MVRATVLPGVPVLTVAAATAEATCSAVGAVVVTVAMNAAPDWARRAG